MAILHAIRPIYAPLNLTPTMSRRSTHQQPLGLSGVWMLMILLQWLLSTSQTYSYTSLPYTVIDILGSLGACCCRHWLKLPGLHVAAAVARESYCEILGWVPVGWMAIFSFHEMAIEVVHISSTLASPPFLSGEKRKKWFCKRSIWAILGPCHPCCVWQGGKALAQLLWSFEATEFVGDVLRPVSLWCLRSFNLLQGQLGGAELLLCFTATWAL